MSVPNPLLFLVTGAWHQQAHYQAFATQLAKIGLTLHVTVYKSVILDPDQPTDPTAQDDTDAIRAQLVAQLDAQPERDIVVLTHSYGGVPGGGAAHGLNKAERVKEGKTNGVIGLVYLTALAIAKGESVWVNSVFADASPEEKGDSVGSLQMNKPKEGLVTWDNPEPFLYQDCDEATIKAMLQLLVPQAISSFTSPAPAPAWKDEAFEGKIAYVRHTLDKAIPISGQDRMIRFSKREWILRTIETSHSAFASKPAELAGIVEELVGLFKK